VPNPRESPSLAPARSTPNARYSLLSVGTRLGADSRLIGALWAFVPEVMRPCDAPGSNIALERQDEMWVDGSGLVDAERNVRMMRRSSAHSISMGRLHTSRPAVQLAELGVMCQGCVGSPPD